MLKCVHRLGASAVEPTPKLQTIDPCRLLPTRSRLKAAPIGARAMRVVGTDGSVSRR